MSYVVKVTRSFGLWTCLVLNAKGINFVSSMMITLLFMTM